MSDDLPAWQKMGFKSHEAMNKFISEAAERRLRFMDKLIQSESFKALLSKYDPKKVKTDVK